jgi:hypothetical protein
MLRSVKSLRGFSIKANDGHMGRVHALLFDGVTWAIRYLVVDTGTWLPGRKVLIAAASLGQPHWERKTFPVALTRQQVKGAPDVDVDKPVSRQREIELYAYYDWTPYWGMSFDVVGAVPIPTAAEREAIEERAKGDPNLRSTREVMDYRIHANDGQVGHIDDFIVSDDDWVIRYLVVDTRNWLPGRKVLISPAWVHEIRWENREVWVDVARQDVENSPVYDPNEPVNRQYEVEIYDYYGRPKYWT